LLLVLCLSACAAVTGLDGQQLRLGTDQFASYVEAVFRRQNELLSEFAFALDGETIDSPEFLRLELAEGLLIDACEGLNWLALRRQQQRPLGGPRATRAARTAPLCEEAADQAADALHPQNRIPQAGRSVR
jgi:hypothetical protein